MSSEDGGIDRTALASIVFVDDQLSALEEISHPAINELLDKAVDDLEKPDSIVVYDMAVLVRVALGMKKTSV